MSNSVFPSLAGRGWSVTRTPQWSTRKTVSISGDETAIQDWTFSRYTFDVVHNVLRQGNGIYTPNDTWAEFATLFGFFGQRSGGTDTFLFDDTLDDQVTGQAIGTADGVTKSFQLIRSLGGLIDPIFAPNLGATYNVYVNGSPKVQGTDYVVVPWPSSGASSGTINGTCTTSSSVNPNVLTNVVLAGGLNPQLGEVVTGSGIPFGSDITNPGTNTLTLNHNATASASNVPILISGAGQIVFAVAPPNGQAITADFSYYWPCRFDADKFDFERFDKYRVRVKKMSFMTVKA